MNKLRRAEISFDGLNAEKAIGYLIRENIEIYYVKRLKDRRCVVAVPTHKRHNAVDLLKQKCYNNIQCKLCGFDAFADIYKRHFALMTVLLLILPLLIIMSNVCSDIKLDTTLDYDAVKQVLKEQGVYQGAWLNNVNLDNVENALAKQFDSMYAIVSRHGNTIYVKIIDRVQGLPDVNFDERYDIVANCDGVVSRMTVVQGTALVRVGDTVKKGQVLIEGIRHFSDGTFEEVRAMGEVYATVQVDAFEEYTGSVINLVDSGQTYNYVTVTIGSATSYYKPIPYTHYRVEQTTINLYPLAIDIVYNTVYELTEQVVKVTFSEDVERLKELARNKAKQSITWTVNDEQIEEIHNVGVRVTLTGEIKITDSLVAGGTEQ